MNDSQSEQARSLEQIDSDRFARFQKEIRDPQSLDKRGMLARYFPQTKTGLEVALKTFGVDVGIDAQPAKIEDHTKETRIRQEMRIMSLCDQEREKSPSLNQNYIQQLRTY